MSVVLYYVTIYSFVLLETHHFGVRAVVECEIAILLICFLRCLPLRNDEITVFKLAVVMNHVLYESSLLGWFLFYIMLYIDNM